MFSLRDLLRRPGAVGVFIILQAICFLTIIYANERQGGIFFGATNNVAGRINESRSNLTTRLNYKQRYDELQRAYIDLQEQQSSMLYDNRAEVDSVWGDTAYLQKYVFYPAKVVKNSVTQKDNYFIINKGSQHHIKPHMGVITQDGVVGIVVATNRYYSRVLSILHNRSRITAQLKSEKVDGSLVWDVGHPGFLLFDGIPSHYDVVLGDTVLTSPASRIFPPNLLIGEVVEKEVPLGSSTFRIKVALNVDMRKINDVYVVENLHQSFIEEIESDNRE
jgi:rod shape-determining protein MreC